MALQVIPVGESEATLLEGLGEGQFADVKAVEVSPSKMAKGLSAFANTDGGDLYLAEALRGRNGAGLRMSKQRMATFRLSNGCSHLEPAFNTSS
jgi:hypothetical protein